jgi:hypothetical protein
MWILAVAIAAAPTAGAKDPAPWEFERVRESCVIRHEVDGPEGSIARVELSWRDEGGAGASGTMHRAFPPGSRMTLRFAGEVREWHYGSGYPTLMFSIERFAKARANLLAGNPVDLILETRGKRAQTYTTGVAGVKKAIDALDRCIESARQNSTQPAARWTATTSGTMGVRSCSLDVAGLIGIDGVDGSFHAVRAGGVIFGASSSPNVRPDGGVLRIDLPGTEPWVFDTEMYATADKSRAPPSEHQTRSSILLRELARGLSPTMAFTPRGGKAVPVSMTLENWKVAKSMFDACTSASMGPKPARPVSYTDLRHIVEERPDFCQLTATYQLHGNGIWLVLTSERGKAALKVTHRVVGKGFKLTSMDLRAFGGSGNVTAPDTTLPLDAATFATVRQGLVGAGVEFGIAMSRTESFAAPFGGELGRIEAAMFEACVKARSTQ